ncbi:MAG: hypothetical protein H7239_05575 [Flavobacterium sp.]|nr:hypothetical protein [Flavobacterium sp.]
MKKLILIFTIICAFSLTANAQAKKLSSKEAANADAKELAQVVGLTDTQTQDFARLFEQKYLMLEIPNLSNERKSIVSSSIDAKLTASLNEKQMKALDAKPGLHQRLIK